MALPFASLTSVGTGTKFARALKDGPCCATERPGKSSSNNVKCCRWVVKMFFRGARKKNNPRSAYRTLSHIKQTQPWDAVLFQQLFVNILFL